MADSTVGDVSKMKVVELRKELKSRGLVHTGDKSELVARLQAAMAQDEDHADINLDSDEIDSDGVLEDDDDKDEDTEKDIVLDESAVELALSDQPPPPPAEPASKPQKPLLKRKIVVAKEAVDKNGENKETTHKKIVLNRASSVTVTSVETKTESSNDKAPEDKPVESNKVKITADIDAKTRLEMRAKRFGLPVKVPDADRIEARKKRFNQDSTTSSATKTPISAPDAPPGTLTENFEKLKKRAERFGQSVSKIMSDIENKERLDKRKEKFGQAK